MKTSLFSRKHKIFDNWEQAKQEMQPLQMKTLHLGQKKVLIIRNKTHFYALEDACPHKLARLSKGVLLNEEEIECYWHKYRFHIETGQECEGRNIRPVKTFAWIEEAEGIYLEIQEEEKEDPFSY